MAKIERFEDIEAWKAAREVARRAYDISRSGEFARDFALRDQVQRAAVSIMANIAEGFDSGSNREFLKFLNYALRSATELQSHLYVALDQGYLNEEEFETLFAVVDKCKSLISGFSRYLRSRPKQSNVER
ncbi:MAG: four helix bundle protein [Chloroflexota bacterium]